MPEPDEYRMSVDELTRMAFHWAIQDRTEFIYHAYGNMPDDPVRIEAESHLRQLKAYYRRRWVKGDRPMPTAAEIVALFAPETHPGIVADAMQDAALDADAALMWEWGAWLKPSGSRIFGIRRFGERFSVGYVFTRPEGSGMLRWGAYQTRFPWPRSPRREQRQFA